MRGADKHNFQSLYPDFLTYYSSIKDFPASKLINPSALKETFMDIYAQISDIDPQEGLEKSQELIREYRKR